MNNQQFIINRERTQHRLGAVTAFLCVMPLVWFSYLPFLYMANAIGVNKTFLFLVLVTLVLLLQIFRVLSNDWQIKRDELTALLLYMLFPLYALIGFILGGVQNTAAPEILSISIVNTFFVLQALSFRHYKKNVIQAMATLLSIYLIFLIYSLWSGSFSLTSSTFQAIFPGLAVRSIYQNIGMYFGLLAILLLTSSAGRVRTTSFVSLGLVVFLLVAMLAVGARAALAGIMIVLILYFIARVSRARNPRLFFVGGISLFAALVIFALIGPIAEDVSSMLGIFRIVALFEGGDASARLYLFTQAIQLALADVGNLIFGAGINAFTAQIGKGVNMYPHNIVLELLSEYGLIGLLLFFVPIAFIVTRRLNVMGSVAGDNRYEEYIFYVALYLWVIFSFTGSLSSSWLLLFFTYLLLPRIDEDHDKQA